MMEILAPITATISIASSAVLAGCALEELCKGCAKAEKEVSQATQTMENRKITLHDWEAAWKHVLEIHQQDRAAGIGYSTIWGPEHLEAIQHTIPNIKVNFQDVKDLLMSCGSPDKTRKVPRRTRKIPLFIRLFYPSYTIKIVARQGQGDRNSKKGFRLRDKIKWCTSIRKQVYSLLDMIKYGQEDLSSISKRGFDTYRSTDRNPNHRVLVEKLTVPKAFVQFRQVLEEDPMNLSVVGHALMRERETVRDVQAFGCRIYDRATPLEARIQLAFIAEPQARFRPSNPMVLFAEVTLDTRQNRPTPGGFKVTFCELTELDVSMDREHSLVDIIRNDPDIDTWNVVLKRVQMALTICLGIFELYESGCLSADLTIADIFSYQHQLLSETERFKVLYREQLYIRVAGYQNPRPQSTPFDVMPIRTSGYEASTTYGSRHQTTDGLLHRVGIILFEIGYGQRYKDVFARQSRFHNHVDMIEDRLDRMNICEDYSNLVRQCLSGTVGADVVEVAESNAAQNVIKQLGTIEDTISELVG